MQDDKVTKMAEALLSGGKMLSLHCAKCRGPLFEKDGKITCAVCGENFADVQKAEAVKPVAAMSPALIGSPLAFSASRILSLITISPPASQAPREWISSAQEFQKFYVGPFHSATV